MIFKRGYELYRATDTDLTSTTFWVLMQQLFITAAYYIGDSENIEQMQNELCILFLEREHSETRGLRTLQKRVPFQTNIINKYTCYTNKSSYFYNCV